jgi:hypothetical protein
MHSDGPQPMTEAEHELVLDDIETMFSSSITALNVAQSLFHADTATLYPDEAIAAEQCRRDLLALATSIKLRRERGNSYAQPERVAELGDRLQK